jgi:phospholipid/cholesterol/gamma-HCH transport system substrate-binding protein
MKLRKAFVKLTVFVVFSVFVLVVMWNTLSNSTSGATSQVSAIFTDASGLRDGDSVRIAGVRVGRVDDVELDNNLAKVTMTIEKSHPVQTDTRLLIRYENLLGRRYVSLRPGPRKGSPLADGAVVPIARTEPAFDITELMNGFQPLFDLLSKDDINKLSDAIIKVLQGEGASVEDLLAEAGRVTSNIADHDQAIGEVITNLAAVLDQLSRNDDRFVDLVHQLTDLVHGLGKHKDAIGNTIERVDSLTVAVDGLVGQARPEIRGTVIRWNAVLGSYARVRDVLDQMLMVLPDFMVRPARVFQHGSWLTLYPCAIRTTPLLPVDLFDVAGNKHSDVCR